jgi:hypothetical protein
MSCSPLIRQTLAVGDWSDVVNAPPKLIQLEKLLAMNLRAMNGHGMAG